MIEPRENDILKGRGVNSYNHKGNVQFRKLILENSDRYNQCSNRKEKSDIISSIYTQITSGYGGRFLEASDTKSGSSEESYRESWREVDQFEAKKKISQSLRDEKKRQRQRSTNKTSETCVTEDDSTLSRRRKRPRLTDSREQSSMQTMTTGTNSSSSQGEQTSSSTSPLLPSNVSAPPLHATAIAAAPLLNNSFSLPPLSAATISDAMSGFSNSNHTSAMGSNNIQNILPWSLHSSLNNLYLPSTTVQVGDFTTFPNLAGAPGPTSATSSNSRNSQMKASSLCHLSTTNPLQTTEQLVSQFRRDHPTFSDVNTITSSSKASFSASGLLNSLAASSAAPSTTSSSNNSSSNLDSKDSSNNANTTTSKSNGLRPSSASKMTAKEIEDCLNFRNPDTSTLDFDTIFAPL